LVSRHVELVGFVLGVAASTRDTHGDSYRDKLVLAVHDYRVPVSVAAGARTPCSQSRCHCTASLDRVEHSPWVSRCRFDTERNIIVVNSGHRDFVFATRNRALQLRYLVRLYVKELVLKNFAGLPADQLLERMIELSLYAEKKLKSS
jgi:hypothetical protein